MAAVALGSFSLGMRFGENKALENMEVPSHSKPDAADPDGPEGPSQPQQTDPSQSRPTQPTEPTQPVVCDHAFSNGICKKCGALEPSSFLTYELNADGKSYTLINGVKETYYDYSVVIADVYEGLPVTAIGEYAFYEQYGNDHLTSVHIPDTITTIGQGAFYGCNGLTGVTIPDSVTTIGNSAFSGCDKLNTVSLGKNVTSIGEDAFLYCMALTTICWSEQTVTIGQDAFTYCENLKKIHLANIASWCASDFVYSDRYRGKSVTNPLEDGAKLYLNGELITDLVIPEGVTRISDYAFYRYDDLKSVTIPDSVTTIGDSAFSYCAALTSVNIPDSVTTIGDFAFYSCAALTSVNIPDSVTTIGSYAFSGCDNLAYKRYDTAYYLGNESNPYLCLIDVTGTDISGCNIHKDTQVIAGSAFYGCRYLTNITLPDGLRSIGDSAFSNTGLTAITIPNSVTSIGNSVFYQCTELSEVTLPAGLTEIGRSMFYICSSLKSIAIPEGVTTIGGYAFYESGIKNIVIPEGVTTLEPYAFSGSKVESITLPASLKRIGVSAFAENSMYGVVKNVYITDLEAWYGIEFESSHANPLWRGATLYLNGEAVTELVIPEGVTSIGNYAFYGSKITSVTIPASVTSIGDSAFGSCTKLQTITFAGTLEQWYAVSLGTSWTASVPTKKIICSDGEANL